MNKTSELWEKIFSVKAFDLSQDLHFIKASEIKEITNTEPRVMAKIDSSSGLPDIFKRNGYFILPIKNKEYAIVRGDGFHRLEQLKQIKEHVSHIKFHLTTAGRGLGEMQYLDYGFNSGAIERIFGEAPLYQSIRGREYSRQFKFRINKITLEASSVQLEVDSGLEGRDSIILIEAKVNTPEDFLIRQLFYPYNHFKIISPNKKIIPVFFSYEPSDKIYNFWIYEFTDHGNYNSIRFKETHSFRIITRQEFEIDDIKAPGLVAFKDLVPQANDLNKVIELVFKVNEGINNYRQIAGHFYFNERQSSYYREAAEALGLVYSDKGEYYLTDVGKKLANLPVEKRHLFMADLLSDFNLIKDGLEILRKKQKLTVENLGRVIEKRSNLSGTTVPRRASSLFAWFKWIAESTGSMVYEDGILKLR